MSWTQALTELRAALEVLFDSPDAITIVLDEAGIPRARVNLSLPPTHAWHGVLTEAHRLKRVEAVIAAARRTYPTNARLAEAGDLYLRASNRETAEVEGRWSIGFGAAIETAADPGAIQVEFAAGSAVRAGIVAPLDFTVASPLSQERFLLGVDTAPSHVAANLNLERPTEEAAIAAGIREDEYVVIVGPSGSGKSALLWRAARNCDWVAAKARVLRLTDSDVPELVHWVQLQQPSSQAPLLLCCDNLGRGSTSGWAAMVRQLRGMAGVVLLGAARREDFQSELVASSPRVVEPALTSPLSEAIATTLRSRGVTVSIDPAEAFAKSGGLLMEFLYLLLAGRRMRDVVTAQIHERLGANRATEREALRYVCSAHRLGLAVPADTLNELLKEPTDLPAALLRLRHEHLVVENDNTEWVGLHELRSESRQGESILWTADVLAINAFRARICRESRRPAPKRRCSTQLPVCWHHGSGQTDCGWSLRWQSMRWYSLISFPFGC